MKKRKNKSCRWITNLKEKKNDVKKCDKAILPSQTNGANICHHITIEPPSIVGEKWWESQFRTVPFSVFPCRVVPWQPLCIGTAATQVGWPESALRPLLSQDQYTITPFWAMAHHFAICFCSLSAKDSYSSTFMHFLTYSSLKNGYTQGDAYIYSICRRTSLQTYHVFINAHTCLQAWPQQPGGKKKIH